MLGATWAPALPCSRMRLGRAALHALWQRGRPSQHRPLIPPLTLSHEGGTFQFCCGYECPYVRVRVCGVGGLLPGPVLQDSIRY